MAYVGQHILVDVGEDQVEHCRVSELLAYDVVRARPLHDEVSRELFVPPDCYAAGDGSEVEYMPVTGDSLDAIAEWCGGNVAGTEMVTLPVRERTVAAPTGTTLILMLTDDREAGWRVRTANGSAIQEAWF